jgi:hypothetical protein
MAALGGKRRGEGESTKLEQQSDDANAQPGRWIAAQRPLLRSRAPRWFESIVRTRHALGV